MWSAILFTLAAAMLIIFTARTVAILVVYKKLARSTEIHFALVWMATALTIAGIVLLG